MRYLVSRPFLVGVILIVAALASTPLFVTGGQQTCTTATEDNPSWDCVRPFRFNFTIPALIGVSGAALMLVTVVRTHRAGRN